MSSPPVDRASARVPEVPAVNGHDLNNALHRAEGLVDQAGERVGHLAAIAAQRVQTWTRHNREAKVVPSSAVAKTASIQAEDTGPDSSAALDRAEGMVDLAGERVGHLAALLSQRLQVWGGRAREEAEDIWAEAQNIRSKGRI